MADDKYRRYRKAHPDRVNATRRANRAKHLEAYREREREYQRRVAPHLKLKFGITLVQYETILAEQGGGCAICGATTSRKADQKRFCVDHDHNTNEVRGLLCAPCNRALGGFDDSVERLIAALRYLTKEHQ